MLLSAFSSQVPVNLKEKNVKILIEFPLCSKLCIWGTQYAKAVQGVCRALDSACSVGLTEPRIPRGFDMRCPEMGGKGNNYRIEDCKRRQRNGCLCAVGRMVRRGEE
jgi:hypothetical protein